MNSFISKLVDRHVDTNLNVQPRVRGRFDHDPGFSPAMEEEDTAGLPTNELNRPSSVSSTQESKDPGIDKYMPAITPPLLTTNADEKEDAGEKKYGPIKIVADPILAAIKTTGENKKSAEDKKSIEDKKPVPVPGELIITRLQKKYFEKIHFVKSENEELQPDGRSVNRPILTGGPLPVLQEPDKPVLLYETLPSTAKENDKTDPSFVVPDVKSKPGYHLPNVLSKTETTQSINISIGRIEIRAALPQIETRIISKKEETGILSLDQYLEQRNTGKR